MADLSVASSPLANVEQTLGTAELLFRRADDMGLGPDWIIPGGLFMIRANGGEQYINFARSPLNSHTNASLANDKYLTRRILERHGIKNIPFMLPRTHSEAELFLCDHSKIVAKPVTGSGARDIHIITAPEELAALKIKKYILEKYIAGKEMRYLVLNDSVIGVHRSDYGDSVATDRPLDRISYPAPAWDSALIASAVQTTRVLGLRFAAVDYLIDDISGQSYVLEVNTAPGLKWFHAPTSGPAIDAAGQFLAAIVNKSPVSSSDGVYAAMPPDYLVSDGADTERI